MHHSPNLLQIQIYCKNVQWTTIRYRNGLPCPLPLARCEGCFYVHKQDSLAGLKFQLLSYNFDWDLYESPCHLCLAMAGISTITAHVIVADAFTATNVHESICLRFHPLTRMFTLVQITTLSMLSRPIREPGCVASSNIEMTVRNTCSLSVSPLWLNKTYMDIVCSHPQGVFWTLQHCTFLVGIC